MEEEEEEELPQPPRSAADVDVAVAVVAALLVDPYEEALRAPEAEASWREEKYRRTEGAPLSLVDFASAARGDGTGLQSHA